jgi:hypothetical protein
MDALTFRHPLDTRSTRRRDLRWKGSGAYY